ncbi:MAG: SxtJ family membrane protein [Pseudodesulfovibrio sp.]|uniref:SxtJ n=1 Tax=Pseudodesulfovibrio indicus TaxID=1716143 RepID=A0A126QRY5_9BACT|nr:SxtJ family membrane protein [Pseudodesulfovibrio indicus]AMK12833.1 hypothetical protein AWY79_17850 [Pseudodesulfovibrio indicus]TDT82065.1 hypothetical protein EDC59_11744 [Pseudodesulfovibrio indicus]
MIDSGHKPHTGFIPGTVTRRECVDTGMAVVLGCLLAGLFTGGRDWFLASVAFLVLNMVWPKAYTLAARAWLGLSNALGTVMSKVVLSVVFFLVLTPLALLRRVLGHDPMKLKQWKQSSASVFEVRDHTFTPEEIERPF